VDRRTTTAWWRDAIAAEIDRLLNEGEMSETNRTHVIWAIGQAWEERARGQPSRDKRQAS
jgi:hypothetical protein